MTSQDPDPTQSTPIAPTYQPAAVPQRPAPPTSPPGGDAPSTSPSTGGYAPPTSPPPPLAGYAPPTPPPPPGSPPVAEPAWRPPPSDYGRNGAFVFGVILVLVGLWFFATTTLGLDLPRLDWGALWPLLLIGLGAWIVLGALGRRR